MSFPLSFALRQSSEEAVFQHMALCSAARQLTHWVLPGPAQHLLTGYPYYPICEAPAAMPLPAHEVDGGECTVASPQPATPLNAIRQGLHAGHLLLHLHGRALRGAFTLARLSPKSHIWRLSVGHPVALSLARQK